MLIRLQCVMVFLIVLIAVSCKSLPTNLKEKELAQRLSAEDWKVREKSIFALSDVKIKDYRFGDKTQKELLNLLEKEISSYTKYKDRLHAEGKSADQISDDLYKTYPPQTYGDYIMALVFLVASKKVDNSLPLIFKLMVDTDYNVSPAVLTLYDTKNLDFFIEKIIAGTNKERAVAVSVLAILINPSDENDEIEIETTPLLSKSELKKAENAYISAIRDPDYNVRYIVLSGLGNLVDRPEILKIVEDIAKSDTEQFMRRKASDILRGIVKK